ncbi:MAG: hypothetical protein IKI05_00435 [Bacteroidaceae bacterium]|nr:hypothetical protein [Bacteroidaceae bacterium]MBR7027863.1 hypothetical protein [Bacteroidaceae bacterium]
MKRKSFIRSFSSSILLAIVFSAANVLVACNDKEDRTSDSESRYSPIAGFVSSDETYDDDSETVFVSRYGECYHTRPSCAGRHPSTTSLTAAKMRGRRACMKCARGL